MKLKNAYRKINFWLQRNGFKTLKGEQVKEQATPDHIEDENVDECVFGDSFMIYTESELNAIVEKGLQQLRSRPGADGEVDPTFIVDVFNIHHAQGINTAVPPLGKIPQRQGETAVESVHDAFRNKGHHEQPDGVDSKINFQMGKFYHINGDEVWPDWADYGVNYSSSGNGVHPRQMAQYCKALDPDTDYSEGRRFAFITYRRMTGSSAIGFAYVAASATNDLAASFVRSDYLGDRRYEENDQDFRLTSSINKTTIHEVGHSLGLWHTFHFTDDCTPETNPLIQGDRVADTPSHPRTSYCGHSIEDLPGASHMSYASHAWRRIFSQGQVDRMKAVVANSFPNMVLNTNTTEPVYGCTDSSAINYNPNATHDDGSCIARVPGCTDETAINYNPDANVDDGSCQFEVLGCTDPKATNYDPKATKNDGSCKYAIKGCTDPDATNYNPDATEDDGSCEYPPDEPTLREKRHEFINSKHVFSPLPIKGFVGVLYTCQNSSGRTVTVVADECGNVNDTCMKSLLQAGETYELKSITDQITGQQHEVNTGVSLEVSNDKMGFVFTGDAQLQIPGITFTDYTITTYFKQIQPQNGVNAYIEKRDNWNASNFYLFGYDKFDGNLMWDNTHGNRIDTGTKINQGDKCSIIASRDTGLYLNGDKIAEPNDVNQVENTSVLKIGNDLSKPGRQCGAIVHEIVVCYESLSEKDILDFNFSTIKQIG